ncbi:MAG TPA: ATP-binding protein, partial [Actinomycetota bacterium]
MALDSDVDLDRPTSPTPDVQRGKLALLRIGEQMAGTGSWELDLATQRLTWSEGLFRLLGLEPGSIQPSFATFMDRIHPDELSRVQREIEDGMLSGQPFAYEARLVLPDGTVRHLRSANEVLLDERGLPVRVVGVGLDVTELRRALHKLTATVDKLRASDQQRRRLLQRVTGAQEEERKQIAEDIHDDSIQIMTAAGMRLSALRRRVRTEQEQEEVKAVETTVRSAIARLRRLMFELRPPALDRDGLATALQLYVEAAGRFGDLATTQIDDRFIVEPSPEVRAILYRIAQEALTNVRKHAQASEVTVALTESDSGFGVTVIDDGRGFDQDVSPGTHDHLGFTAMRERAEMAGGHLTVRSTPGEGTEVTAWIPEIV